MSVFHPKLRRLTELLIYNKSNELSLKQTLEFTDCVNWLIEKYWEDAKIDALSHFASETNDDEWQNELLHRVTELRKDVM